MEPAQNPRSRFAPSRGGALVVLGLLAFGGLILGGLYLAPKAYAPKPPNVPFGVPARTLRLVTYDLHFQNPATDPQFTAIAAMNPVPDYVFLQGVNEDDVPEIVERLAAMRHSFHPQLYQRSERLAGRSGTWGNLILSKQDLYLGSPLGGERGGYGAVATSVVDDRKFLVACVHLAPGDAGDSEARELAQFWKAQNCPPLLVALLPDGPRPPNDLGFLPIAIGMAGATVYTTSDWAKEGPAGKIPGQGEWFFLSMGWSIVAHGTTSTPGSGLVPFWIDVTEARPATTQP